MFDHREESSSVSSQSTGRNYLMSPPANGANSQSTSSFFQQIPPMLSGQQGRTMYSNYPPGPQTSQMHQMFPMQMQHSNHTMTRWPGSVGQQSVIRQPNPGV